MKQRPGIYPKYIEFRGNRYKFYRLFSYRRLVRSMAETLRKEGIRVATRRMTDKAKEPVFILYTKV